MAERGAWAAAAMLALACHAAPAAAPAPAAGGAPADPALEKRVMRLSEELRCLVCQNQTIADSNADLAVDLRNQVREQLRQGKSEDDVRRFMVARYGDFVLYRPPLKAATLLLWFGPPALLAVGLAVLFVTLRRRRALAGADEEGGLVEDDDPAAAALGSDAARRA
ncbi:MAG: cytochrome c-type biogenesis protein CcmH [Burkholderiales bacterium]|nr:cytochrome c-type biogenesis protein CcmH [Burkholderiales bacterium]